MSFLLPSVISLPTISPSNDLDATALVFWPDVETVESSEWICKSFVKYAVMLAERRKTKTAIKSANGSDALERQKYSERVVATI